MVKINKSNSVTSTAGAAHAQKGSYLSELYESYVALDLETTGLSPAGCAIIEMAAVRVEDNRIVDKFQMLVNPGCKINSFITQLTGITNRMLEKEPPIEDTLPLFLDFIGDSVILGHNVCFDLGFICENCRRVLEKPFPNDYIDTMRLSRKLFKEERHHRLGDLVCRFGIGESVEHRALSDAIQTHECYQYMKGYIARYY